MIIYSTKYNVNKYKLIKKIIYTDNWEKRYLNIINLNNFLLKKVFNYSKYKNNIIYFCKNYIWIIIKLINKNIFIYCHSDSLIIKGIISIILIIFNNINYENNIYYCLNFLKKINFIIKKKNIKYINMNKLFNIELIIRNKIINFIKNKI